MNTPERKEKIQEKAKIIKELAEKKGYHKETIEVAAAIAGTKQMQDKYGDFLQCLDKIIELIKQYDDGSQFVTALVKLAGFEID